MTYVVCSCAVNISYHVEHKTVLGLSFSRRLNYSWCFPLSLFDSSLLP